MQLQIVDLQELFDGCRYAHGLYSVENAQMKGSKVVGRAHTIRANVTAELWQRHLSGEMGLGIIPINQDSEVKFAAIDVDQYPIDLGALHGRIRDLQLPLVICRTKSGGAHLYLFLKKFYPAKDVQGKVKEFASALGYGACEIFPKQTKIIAERGDMGQWINMPYFRGTERCMVNERGEDATLDQFIAYAKSKMLDLDDLRGIGARPVESLVGGPPCLQHLIKMGFPPGTRNNGLFNLAVYARKLSPDNWKNLVVEMNQRYMTPPLDTSDVQGVIKSADKKEFNYMCSQQPISNFCNRDLCVTCEHGVGGGIGFPKFGTLTKVLTNPPLWFLEIEGGERIELSTEDLQSPRNFQFKCMETLNIMPPLIKVAEWTSMVRQLLEQVIEIEVPFESTPIGILHQYLVEFCTSRVAGKTLDDLILGKPYTEKGRHYFRVRDFLDYLERQRFRLLPLNQISNYLKELRTQHHFMVLRGKGMNIYSIEEFRDNKQTLPFDTPKEATKPY